MSRSRKDIDHVSQDELHREIVQTQLSGTPTVGLCNLLRHMAHGQIRLPSFNRYTPEEKEDMESYALLKCLKNLHNIKTSRSKASCWNYIYLCVRCAFLEVIAKEYKQKNIAKALAAELEAEKERIFPTQQNKGDRTW